MLENSDAKKGEKYIHNPIKKWIEIHINYHPKKDQESAKSGGSRKQSQNVNKSLHPKRSKLIPNGVLKGQTGAKNEC